MQTKGKNYEAWDIRDEDLSKCATEGDRIQHILSYGILAPSSHNSQPWRLSMNGSKVEIFFEETRLVPFSDPLNIHAAVAVGAFVENVVIASHHYGYQVSVTWNGGKVAEEPLVTLQITKRNTENDSDAHKLFSAITKRRSNRNPHEPITSPEDVLVQMRACEEGVATIQVVQERTVLHLLADFLMERRIIGFSIQKFRDELAQYKRTNFTSSETGMPGFTMGFSDLLSLFAPTLIKYVNVMKPLRKSEHRLLAEKSPAIGFVLIESSTLEEAFLGGRVLERTLLLLTSLGIATAPSAVPPDRTPLKKILKTDKYPLMMFRFGMTTQVPPHSPRIPLRKVFVGGGFHDKMKSTQ